MTTIITFKEILLSFGLIGICSLISILMGLKLERKLLYASARGFFQLSILGHILTWIFKYNNFSTLLMVFIFMIVIASWTAIKRIKRNHKGVFIVTFFSIFFTGIITISFTLLLALPQDPWYNVQNAIPLIGMILGNSLTGISLTLDKFTNDLIVSKSIIEDHLSIGATRFEAAKNILADSLQTGLTPILNSMMVVGLVSIPGIMTGQILAGENPFLASKFQIIILLIICASTFIASLFVVTISFFRFFNNNHTLNEKLLMRMPL
jgi:putative ABC transport system permease protein